MPALVEMPAPVLDVVRCLELCFCEEEMERTSDVKITKKRDTKGKDSENCERTRQGR